MPLTELDFNQVDDDNFASQNELDNNFPFFNTIAELETYVNGSTMKFVRVGETNTLYYYLVDGSNYTVDGQKYISTADGGDTRWVAIGGEYSKYTTEAGSGIVEVDGGSAISIYQSIIEEISGGDVNGD